METKTCRVCKEAKPLDLFGKLRGGLAYECKPCKRELDKAYRERHAESVKQKKREYYLANAERIKQKSKSWYESNKDYAIARQSAYVESRKEWYSAYKKRWREANKLRVVRVNAEYRAKNREAVRKATADWLAANPLKRKEYFHTRRARMKNAGGSFTAAQIDDLRHKQRGKCACCRCSLQESGEHIDHVVPLARGGTNDILNIQLLCPTCNTTKNAKDPIDFMQQNGFLL